MESFPSKELVNELEKRGMKLVPTNRDALAIKGEPRYRLEKSGEPKDSPPIHTGNAVNG